MFTEKRKQQIQDWLVAIGVTLFIVVVPTAIALVVAAREEEWQTIYCVTTATFMTCISGQPCNTYARSQKGELSLPKANVNWPHGTPPGDFNQAEFERAVESRCGKIK